MRRCAIIGAALVGLAALAGAALAAAPDTATEPPKAQPEAIQTPAGPTAIPGTDAAPDPAPTATEPDPLPAIEVPIENPERDLSYWRHGEPRFFIAWRFDVGILFLRPRASFGWGRPHAQWVGFDVNPIISNEGIGAWGGLRIALDNVDLRVGARTHYAFQRSLLQPAHKFDHESIDLRAGPIARYTSLEAEFTWGLPIGRVVWFGEAAGTYVTSVKDGFYVFEETIRVVVEPPWVWRARTGVAFDAGLGGALTLGPVVELVGVPKRGMVVLRAGLSARMKLYDDLEARVTLLPQILSRDDLGLGGGDSFQVGLRWKWATGTTPETP